MCKGGGFSGRGRKGDYKIYYSCSGVFVGVSLGVRLRKGFVGF